MRLDSKIITNPDRVIANWYDAASPEVFDVMALDRPYNAYEIADRLPCFRHLRARTRVDYTKVVLQKMARTQAEQGTHHLIQHAGKWIAPSRESSWYAQLGIRSVDDD